MAGCQLLAAPPKHLDWDRVRPDASRNDKSGGALDRGEGVDCQPSFAYFQWVLGSRRLASARVQPGFAQATG